MWALQPPVIEQYTTQKDPLITLMTEDVQDVYVCSVGYMEYKTLIQQL